MVAEKPQMSVFCQKDIIYYPEPEMGEYFIPVVPNIPETLGPAGLESNPDQKSLIYFSPGIKIVRPDQIYLKYSVRSAKFYTDRIFHDNQLDFQLRTIFHEKLGPPD